MNLNNAISLLLIDPRLAFTGTDDSVQTKGAAPTGAESPTTARPLEMDDDDVQETGVLGEDGTPITSTTVPAPAPDSEETAPPKPPRPLTEAQKNQQILKEAFPGVDDGVIKAILSASGSRVEPAFNALLGELLLSTSQRCFD